jgi:hypothetical protein
MATKAKRVSYDDARDHKRSDESRDPEVESDPFYILLLGASLDVGIARPP